MEKEITFEQAKEIMDYIADTIKNEVGINELDLTKCWESSFAIQRFCYGKFKACPLKTTGLGFPHLTHCFDIVSISSKYSFIVDLIYKQFDTEKYPLGIINNKKVYIKGPYKNLSEKNQKEIEIVGYIPLTKENLADYLYSLIESYKDKFNIDEEFVLSETLGTIKDYGINLCDMKDFRYSTNIESNQK